MRPESSGHRLSAGKLRLLRQRAELGRTGLRPRPGPGNTAPVSEQQRALWFLDQFIGPADNSAYNIDWALRLGGQLQVPALERALSEIVRRHEILRTTFDTVDGDVVQRVHPAEPVVLAVRKIDSERAVREFIAAEAVRPFDLHAGPLFRAGLVRRGPREHVLLLGFHHAVLDGWSAGVLWHELSVLYAAYSAGEPSPLPPRLIQYADFATWQQDVLAGGALEPDVEYWRDRLRGAPALSTFPADRPRPVPATFAGRELLVRMPSELIGRLDALARAERASLFMVLLAAFQALLARYSHTTDVCVGAPVAGRSRPECEPMIGYFVNSLVMRGDLAGNPSLLECLTRTRTVVLDAFQHQDVPFDLLVERLRPERSASHAPLFQTMFALQEPAGEGFGLQGLDVRFDETAGDSAKFDLTVVMWPEPDAFVTAFEYATDLYDPGTIEGLAEDFQSVLATVAADPGVRLDDIHLSHVRCPLPVLTSAAEVSPPRHVEARTATEHFLLGLWVDLLERDRVGVLDDFFDLGGHSFLVMRAVSRIRRALGISIPASAVFQARTVAALAQMLDERRDVERHSPLVPLAPGGSGPPLFLAHPVGGGVVCYQELARGLAGQAVGGFVARGLDGHDEPLDRVEDMAAAYLDALDAGGHRPPYILGGWSMGGVVAYEMARLLRSRTRAIVPLLMIDSYAPGHPIGDDLGDAALLAWFAEDWGGAMGVDLGVPEDELISLPEPARLPHLLARARCAGVIGAEADVAMIEGMVRVFRSNTRSLRSYRPPAGYPGPIALLAAELEGDDSSGPDHGWGKWTTGEVVVRTVPGDHYGILHEPGLLVAVSELRDDLWTDVR